jgi:CheY-like chemotaxis protein
MLASRGATPRHVGSAREALAVIERFAPDALVADVVMPDEDGYAMLRRIRGLAGNVARVPALALTVHAHPDAAAAALAAGYQRHLAKPVDADALCAAVTSLTRGRAAP